MLAESDSTKRKYLYVLGTEHPLKFLNGGRTIRSVLSRNNEVRERFYARFGETFVRVRDYYRFRVDNVSIVGISPWLPELANTLIDETGYERV